MPCRAAYSLGAFYRKDHKTFGGGGIGRWQHLGTSGKRGRWSLWAHRRAAGCVTMGLLIAGGGKVDSAPNSLAIPLE